MHEQHAHQIAYRALKASLSLHVRTHPRKVLRNIVSLGNGIPGISEKGKFYHLVFLCGHLWGQ